MKVPYARGCASGDGTRLRHFFNLTPGPKPQTISFDAADARLFEGAAQGGNIIFAGHGPTSFELFDGYSANDGAAGKLSPLPTRARAARHWAGVI